MAARAKTTDTATEVEYVTLQRGRITFRVLGRTPVILNRLSEKAKRELLLGGRRKNQAERASTLKHNPPEEFRASPYRLRDEDAPTLLAMPSMCFKNATASAALDIPGAAKAQIGRLVYVEGDYVALYGVPELFMAVVRSADINRTPDIRTRAILRNWACEITMAYAQPILSGRQVSSLFANAGLIRGVGDWRPEKGKGDYGQFELVSEDDERWQKIVTRTSRSTQQAALNTPACYDLETEELLDWFKVEVTRREINPQPNGDEDDDGLVPLMKNGAVHVAEEKEWA